MVRTKANIFSGSDDALVKRLQKEIIHLRDILNIRRKGGKGELAEQLLLLKDENSRLKENNISMKDVERLMEENKLIKLELQRMMANNTHQNFNNNENKIDMGNEEENLRFTDYNGNAQWNEDEEAKPLNQTPLGNGINLYTKAGITDSEYSENNRKENINTQENKILSISSLKQDDNFSPRETNNTADKMFPSVFPNAPLSKIIQNKIKPKNSNSNNSTNFSNFQMGSAHLKESLSKKGRWPLCTLQIPWKHYNDISELPQLPPSKYTYLPSSKPSESMPPIHNTARNYTIDIDSSSKLIFQIIALIEQISRRESELRTTSPVPLPIPDIFNPNPYPPHLQKSNAFSPRSSQKLNGFLHSHLNSNDTENSRRGRKDYKLFYGNQKSENLKANVRIRGRSNIIDTQEGSLLHSIYEQKEESKRNKELKQAKK